MTKKSLFSVLLVLFFIFASLFLFITRERHFSGYLLWGFETAVFIERDPGEELNYRHSDAEHHIWIGPSNLAGELYNKAPETVIYDLNGQKNIVKLLKVDFMGRLSLPGMYGHLSQYLYQIEITKVNKFEVVKSQTKP